MKNATNAAELVAELSALLAANGGEYTPEMGVKAVALFEARGLTPVSAGRALRWSKKRMGVILAGAILGGEGYNIGTAWFWGTAPAAWLND